MEALYSKFIDPRDERFHDKEQWAGADTLGGKPRTYASPEEIADRIGHLSLAQVHAALAYHHANRTEIDTDLVAEQRAYERRAGEHGS